MPKLLLPVMCYPLWLSDNKSSRLGNFCYLSYDNKNINTNPNYYRGKAAVLVDENTQSIGEANSIWFNYTLQNSTIGSPTAGGGGNN